jgi:hypothetical protein
MMTDKKIFTGAELFRILDEVNKDTSLQNTLNINDILLNSKHNDFADSFETVFNTIKTELDVPHDVAFSLSQKLTEYDYIDELHELTIGKYIRWIRKQTGIIPIIAHGGIVHEIIFEDSKIVIRVFQIHNRYSIKLKYDNFLIFQKRR